MRKKKVLKFFSVFICAILLISASIFLTIGLTSCVKKSSNNTKTIEDNTCTITFNANGGKGSMRVLTVNQYEEVTLPDCEFTKDGYKFIGWGINKNEVTYEKNTKISVYSSFTLYAIWDNSEVTITFKSSVTNGEYSEKVSPGSYSLPGYDFISEKLTPKLEYEYIAGYIINNKDYGFNESILVNEDITISVYTSACYTIRFFLAESNNGNSYSGIDYYDFETTIKADQTTVDLVSDSYIIEQGLYQDSRYDFIGWNYISASDNEAYKTIPLEDFLNNSNAGMVYMRPVYQIKEFEITITKESSDSTTNYILFTKKIKANETFKLPDPSELGFEILTEGYYFKDYIDSEETSVSFPIGGDLHLTGNPTLYVRTSNVYYFNFCCRQCDKYVTEEVTYGSTYKMPSGRIAYDLGYHEDENGNSHHSSLTTGMNFKYWTTHKLYDDLDETIYQDTEIVVNNSWIKDKENHSTTFYQICGGMEMIYRYHKEDGSIAQERTTISGQTYTIESASEAIASGMDAYNSKLIGWSLTPNSLHADYLIDQTIVTKNEYDGIIDLYPVYSSPLIGVIKYIDHDSRIVTIEKTRYPIHINEELTLIDPETGNSFGVIVTQVKVNGTSVDGSKTGDTVELTLNNTYSGVVTTFFLVTERGEGVTSNEITKARVTFVYDSYAKYFTQHDSFYFGLNDATCSKNKYYELTIKEFTISTSEGLTIEFEISHKLIISYYDKIYLFCSEVEGGPFAIVTNIEYVAPDIIIW